MNSSRGVTLLEMLVTLGISSLVLAGLAAEFAQLTKYSRDVEIRGEVRENVRTLLDLIGSDIRNAAAGMPLGQEKFTTADPALGDYALAFLTSSSETSLQLRLNESGKSTTLTQAFDATAMVQELEVLDSSDFESGDSIYVSEITAGGTAGFQATVTSVPSANLLGIDEIHLPTGVTNILAGSQVAKVVDISINYDVTGQRIVRDNGQGPIILAPNSWVKFSYLNSAGIELATPLTAAALENELAAIRVEVEVTSSRKLSSGTAFTISDSLNIVPRNLLIGG